MLLSAFQQRCSLGGSHPLFVLVWYELHLVSPCPPSQNPSNRAAVGRSGPRSKNHSQQILQIEGWQHNPKELWEKPLSDSGEPSAWPLTNTYLSVVTLLNCHVIKNVSCQLTKCRVCHLMQVYDIYGKLWHCWYLSFSCKQKGYQTPTRTLAVFQKCAILCTAHSKNVGEWASFNFYTIPQKQLGTVMLTILSVGNLLLPMILR